MYHLSKIFMNLAVINAGVMNTYNRVLRQRSGACCFRQPEPSHAEFVEGSFIKMKNLKEMLSQPKCWQETGCHLDDGNILLPRI